MKIKSISSLFNLKAYFNNLQMKTLKLCKINKTNKQQRMASKIKYQ